MARISRRDFLLMSGFFAAGGIGAVAYMSDRRWWERFPIGLDTVTPVEPPSPWSIEALHYASFTREGSFNCIDCHGMSEESLPVSYCHIPHTGNYVQCSLCPHQCIIADGERGHCRVRENRGNQLFSMVYGNPCTVHVDPIEKKPFYHFLPTIPAFSLATAGCNLRCLYCQNWNISQVSPEETENIDLPPEYVVSYALQREVPVIAYTYSEPVIFYEYMLETARQARQVGLLNVVISAGFINPEPLQDLCEVVDAIKIDLKGYDEDFYREVCEAELAAVLRAIETVFVSGTHLEIVNLVVPTLNDNLEQLRSLARWVARDLSPDVPLHFSRFHPDYKLANLPPTPVETLEKAREIAMQEGVRFVYIGNLPGHAGNNTYCPGCGQSIIERQGFAVMAYHLREGSCVHCEEQIPGVWWPGEFDGRPVEVLPGPPDQ